MTAGTVAKVIIWIVLWAVAAFAVLAILLGAWVGQAEDRHWSDLDYDDDDDTA